MKVMKTKVCLKKYENEKYEKYFKKRICKKKFQF